jgi:hypothetical protein
MKAKFHLSNALRLNYDNYIILEDLFPWFEKEKYITTLQNIKNKNVGNSKKTIWFIGSKY